MEGSKKTIMMHNVILGFSRYVDHRNGSTLDNRKENIRQASRPENEWNKPKQKTSRGKPCTSKYKGVSLRGGRWVARIKRNGVLSLVEHITKRLLSLAVFSCG